MNTRFVVSSSPLLVLLILGLTACTRWGSQDVYGPQREVARQLLGSPAVAETKSSSVDAGFAGRSNSRGSVVAGLGASVGSTTLKHCVQQADLTFEQPYAAHPELTGRGGDLGLAIGMGVVGTFAFQARSDVGRDESQTTRYLVGGALIAAAVGLLVRSYVIVPGREPDVGATQTKRWVESRLVESSGCGLPGDVTQFQPATPVLTQTAPDATMRLQQLDKLRASGAISDAEYARKRREIVDGI